MDCLLWSLVLMLLKEMPLTYVSRAQHPHNTVATAIKRARMLHSSFWCKEERHLPQWLTTLRRQSSVCFLFALVQTCSAYKRAGEKLVLGKKLYVGYVQIACWICAMIEVGNTNIHALVFTISRFVVVSVFKIFSQVRERQTAHEQFLPISCERFEFPGRVKTPNGIQTMSLIFRILIYMCAICVLLD